MGLQLTKKGVEIANDDKIRLKSFIFFNVGKIKFKSKPKNDAEVYIECKKYCDKNLQDQIFKLIYFTDMCNYEEASQYLAIALTNELLHRKKIKYTKNNGEKITPQIIFKTMKKGVKNEKMVKK